MQSLNFQNIKIHFIDFKLVYKFQYHLISILVYFTLTWKCNGATKKLFQYSFCISLFLCLCMFEKFGKLLRHSLNLIASWPPQIDSRTKVNLHPTPNEARHIGHFDHVHRLLNVAYAGTITFGDYLKIGIMYVLHIYFFLEFCK